MAVVIRPARLSDAAEICAVHCSSIAGLCATSYAPHEIEVWMGLLAPEKYTEPLRKHAMFVAEDEGQVVGFSQLDVEQAHVLAVYVSPTAVRKGIGKALLRRLEAVAGEQGIVRLTLDATLNAESFYAHAGYQRLYVNTHRISADVSLACIRMEKLLARVG